MRELQPNLLTLPNERTSELRDKLKEYQTRREKSAYLAPEFVKFPRNTYKIALLERLLERGSLDPHEVARELRQAHDFDEKKFQEALAVITSYCITEPERPVSGQQFTFALN